MRHDIIKTIKEASPNQCIVWDEANMYINTYDSKEQALIEAGLRKMSANIKRLRKQRFL